MPLENHESPIDTALNTIGISPQSSPPSVQLPPHEQTPLLSQRAPREQRQSSIQTVTPEQSPIPEQTPPSEHDPSSVQTPPPELAIPPVQTPPPEQLSPPVQTPPSEQASPPLQTAPLEHAPPPVQPPVQPPAQSSEEHRKSTHYISRMLEMSSCCLLPLGTVFSSDVLYILYTCSFILLVMGIVFILFGESFGLFIFAPGMLVAVVSLLGSVARWLKKEKTAERQRELNRRRADIASIMSRAQSSATNEAFEPDLPPRYSDIFPTSDSRPPSYPDASTMP